MLSISNLLKRNINLKEAEVILEQITKPALLWNRRDNNFVIINNLAIEISGYSRQESRELKFSTLFPEMEDLPATFIGDFETSANLYQNNGSPIPVHVQFVSISEDRNWVLLIFETARTIHLQEVKQSLEEQRWEALYALSLAPLNKNLTSSIYQALQAGQLLLGSSFLAVYQPESENTRELKLVQMRGETDFLPNEIPLSEISHLRIPFIWTPGKRATSILHQRAISANLIYLATCPVDQKAPQEGIVVVGDQISDPPKEIVQLLQIITGVIISCITHHKEVDKARQEIAVIASRLEVSETVKNIISDGIIFIQEDLEIVDINTTALQVLGYSISEVITKQIDQILITDFPIRNFLDHTQQTLSGVEEIGEINIHRRDGESFLAHVRILRLPGRNRRVNNAILISDLSAREEFKTRAKQLENQAILGEVMAIFAHEVRNPINNISMGLEVLSSIIPEELKLEDDIDRLRIDIERLEDLMKSVLSVSKTREYHMEPFSVLGLIDGLVYRWKPRMDRFNITPKIDAPDGPVVVKGDKRSLERVFTNIIQNGINAMKGKGGSINIRVSDSEDSQMVNIDISDTGPGIPKAIMDRIFDPFFSTNKEGTGLGLAITKQIINAHNGQISVNSVPGGTVFRIKLPKPSLVTD
ncbi:MAG: ATP-binding protein [Anaerolineales bacterium]